MIPTSLLRPGILLALVVATTVRADLRGDITRAIEGSGLPGAQIAVSIRDADSDRSLVSVNGADQLMPASNMKLLTTGAALHVLREDFRFSTRLVRDGDRLVVIGDGDPAFGDPALLGLMGSGGLSLHAFVGVWVEAVREADIDRIDTLVVDDRIFDRDFVHPGWPKDQLNRAYCAEVAGFNFYTNVLRAWPRPTSNRADLSRFEPAASWIHPVNRTSARQGQRDDNTIWAARPTDSNQFTFYGNARYTYRKPLEVTLHDLPSFFIRYFGERLRGAGIEVGSIETISIDAAASRGELIGPQIATPISTVVTRCNRDSQNLYAESLLKRIGAETSGESGSWQNGASTLRQVVHDRLRGQYTDHLRISDGSGLSRGNRVTADLMTAWLSSLHRDAALSDTFVDSLAIGGHSGTLRKRFSGVDLKGAIVQAKSGYINNVSCLSGYVIARSGRRYAFSVLVNGFAASSTVTNAKKLQERVVVEIAEELAAVPTSLGSD